MRNGYYMDEMNYCMDKIEIAVRRKRRRKRAVRQLINCLGGIIWAGGIVIAGSEAIANFDQHFVCLAGLALLCLGSAIIWTNR